MWIDQWLTKYNLTQSDLGRLCGMSNSRVNLITRGKVKPTLEQAANIMKITKGEVTLDELVLGDTRERTLEYKRNKLKEMGIDLEKIA